MYTGAVDSDDWASISAKPGSSSSKEDEVPLELILGGLAISRVYMVPHLLATFTKALQKRLCADSFDAICRCAVKYDVTTLRLSCIEFARRGDHCVILVTGCGMPEFNGTYVAEGTKQGKPKYRMRHGDGENTINYSVDEVGGKAWYLAKEYVGSWYSIYEENLFADVPPEG